MGGIHGALLVINHLWRKYGISLPKVLCWGLTFFSVMMAWIFFRAENFSQALQIIQSMFDFQSISTAAENWRVGKSASRVWLTIAGLSVLLCLPNPLWFIEKFNSNWLWYMITLTVLLVSLYQMNTYTEFLYFQF